MLKFYFFFMAMGLLFLASCSTPTSSEPNNITVKDSLPPKPEGLTLGENQVAVEVYLDDKLYVQLLDTTQFDKYSNERANSPVYECACKVTGACKLVSNGHKSYSCIPTSSGCSSDVQSPVDNGHKCAFRKASVHTALHTALSRSYLENYVWKKNKDSSFNENGMRAVNYYTTEFETPLKALYTLSNGQTIASYFPRNTGNPILITCSCDCPGGADCKMTVNSSSSLSCYSQSNCMPEPDGHPCDGCKFAAADMSLEELEQQAISKQLLKE